MSIIVPVCPTGCTSMPAPVDFDVCAPEILFGEIRHIYVASGESTPFTDVESLSEWTTRISNDAVDEDTIRELMVSADLPAASADEIIISLGRKVYSPATHVINVDIDDLSAANYEFARTTSCNAAYRIWFATESKIYGGTDGILATINLRPVIERGVKSINKLTGTITWDAQFSPEMNDNPFAT